MWGWCTVRRQVKAKRITHRIPIAALVGFCALLLAPRVQTAYAQSPSPHIDTDLIAYTVPAGEYLNAGFALRDFPCVDENNDDDCDYRDKFTSVSYRFDVLHREGGSDADSCEAQGLGTDRTYSPASYDDDRALSVIPLRISRSCQPGLYTLRLTVTYADNANQSHTLTDTVDFVVGDPQPPNPNPEPDPNPDPDPNLNQNPNPNRNPDSNQPQNPQNAAPPTPPPPQDPVAITLPGHTNVRLGPGTEYEIVRSVPRGTRAKIIGLGPWDDWYLVEIDGIYGPIWICQDLTLLVGSLTGIRWYAEGDFGATAITLPPIAHVRTGPSSEYDVLTTVPQGTRAKIIGLGPENKWFLIELPGLDGPAWIHQSLAEVVGSVWGIRKIAKGELELLPRPGRDGGNRPVVITLPEIMNVRLGPGLEYDVITTVPQGTRAPIYGMDPSKQWFQVELAGLDSLAWVNRDLTRVVGSLVNVRRITEREIAALPAAITQPRALHARAGPGTEYDAVTILSKGTWARVVGIGPKAKWYQLEVVGLDEPVWVARHLLKVAGGSFGRFRRIWTGEGALLSASDSRDDRPLAVAQSESMQLRTGPGLEYQVVTTVPQWTRARIMGMDPAKIWFQVELDGLDTLAWAPRHMTWVDGSLVSVRRITAREIAALPAAITQPWLVRARSGPGPEYDVVARLPKGTWARIVAIGPQAKWLQIEVVGTDRLVWVARKLVKLAGGSLAELLRIGPGESPSSSPTLTDQQ